MRSKCAFQLLLILFLVPSFTSLAQKNTNKERATALKLAFKDSKIAAYKYVSDYSFEIRNDVLQVANSETINLISLEGNINYIRPIYYNDQVNIISSEVRYSSGKNLPAAKTCGNYEVEDVFYSDAKVCAYKVNFLYEGTEIDFKAKTVYDDPKYLTKVLFHDELPIKNREVIFSIPLSVNVELVEKNFDGFDIQKKITEAAGKRTYTYTVKDLKALKSEQNSLGILHYYPHIVVVTKDYSAGGARKTVISSVDDLYKWYHGLVREVKNDQAPLKAEVERIIASAKTPEEKIKAIYYWVQDNIKYIAFEDGIAGFKPEAAQNVYHNRYGDCKGMANLTKEMLNVAGFDARLTWIGTNRIPYRYDVPSLAVDNHMICTLMLGDKQYILDPTEKYIALGKYAERIQGKEMLIENGDQYLLKKVPVATADQNLVLQHENITLEGDKLKGQGKIVINGEAKKNILYYSTNVKQEDQKKVFLNLVVPSYGNTDNVEVTNTPPIDRDKAMEVNYKYNLNNKVTRFGNDLYVDLDWNEAFKDLEIEDDRFSDYYFSRKINTKVTKKLKLPPGYNVSHLPGKIVKQHEDFSFVVSFEQRGAELVYSNEIVVKHGLVRRADFKMWNEYIKALNDVYDDQVVLTKSE